jgi:hypothetical protein
LRHCVTCWALMKGRKTTRRADCTCSSGVCRRKDARRASMLGFAAVAVVSAFPTAVLRACAMYAKDAGQLLILQLLGVPCRNSPNTAMNDSALVPAYLCSARRTRGPVDLCRNAVTPSLACAPGAWRVYQEGGEGEGAGCSCRYHFDLKVVTRGTEGNKTKRQ